MPAPATVENFLELGFRSGLIDAVGIDSLRARVLLPIESPSDFARSLIDAGYLTRFQADKLLAGKWRGFLIAGKYRLLERLGAGGMGAVYLCEHLTMDRRVALKVLPISQAKDPASLQRFYREARAVARLDHPNIIRAHDLDHEENLHFLVLEFVDGCNLHDFVRRNGRLSPTRAAHFIHQAALGLEHAHEAGLVHRDIKPSNLLLDRQGTIKLLDMGLARFFGDEHTPFVKEYEQGFVIGTADFVAPEQTIDSQVDIRADIYSLGCTLYFLLLGRSPFPEGTSQQKMLWQQVRMPKPIGQFRGDVPDGLVKVIDKMMAKEPSRRIQSPGELAAVLSTFVTEVPPAPTAGEMPPVIQTSTGRPSSQVATTTDPHFQGGIATPGPRLPKS